MRRSIVLTLAVATIAGGTALSQADPAQADRFGNGYAAIAIDADDGDWGIGTNYGTLRGAKRRALDECGGGCKVVSWVRNGCVALAQGDEGYGTAYAKTRRGAKRLAKQRAGGLDSRTIVSGCG